MRTVPAVRGICAWVDGAFQRGPQACPEAMQRGANRVQYIGILVCGCQKVSESIPIGVTLGGVVWPRLAGGAELREGGLLGLAGGGEFRDCAASRQLGLSLYGRSEAFRRVGEPGV